MTKSEFLMTLRTKLIGEVSDVELENTIRYYDEYITDGMRQEKTEEEILENLGSPLLIARTIIDTAGNQRNVYERNQGYDGYGQKEQVPRGNFHNYEVKPATVKWILIAVVIVVVLLALTILRILLPILIPLLIIGMILRLFRNGGNR